MGHYLKNELYELIKSDERIFDFLQKGSMDGLWYWDLEHPENEWMNERFWETLGYNPQEMPHLASAWQDIINQDDLKRALDNFNKHVADSAHPYDQEVRYTHKNGSIVWVRCRGMAIRDEKGNPIRMLGVHQNITALKNTQKNLYQEKQKAIDNYEKYKAMYENTPLAFQSLNIDGNIVDVNPEWLKILQYDRDEVIGKWFGDFLHQDYVDQFRKNFPQFKKQGCISNVYFKLQKKNGEFIDVSFEGSIGYDDQSNFRQTYCTFKDITEQKRAEEKLVFLNKSITELLTIDNKDQLFTYFTQSIKSLYPNTIVLYVSVNEQRRDTVLESIEGLESSVFKHIQKAVNGKIVGRQYSLTKKHLNIFRQGKFHKYEGSLADFSDNQFPVVGIKIIQKLLKINRVYTIGINKDDNLLGALHLITLNDTEINDGGFLETYTAHFAALVQNLNIKTILRDSEEKFRTIFEYSPIMIDAFDKNGKCILWNKECENKLGYTLEEVNQSEDPISLFYPEAAMRDAVIKTIVNKPDKIFREWSPITKNGKKLPSLWANFRISDEFVISIGLDISMRKEAEEALRHSEARFKALHNGSFGGITIHDKGVILECNNGLSEITGYESEELIGMDGLLLIAEEFRDMVMDHITSGYEKHYEVVGIRKNGEKYPLRLEGRQIPYQGKNVRVVEFRDITEQKEAEAELVKAIKKAEEGEYKVRSMFENTQIGILYCDASGNILEINPVILNILGSPSEEATKKINLLSFQPLLDIGFSQNVKKCIENKQRISEDVLYKSKWGKTVFMKYYLVPVIVDNQVIGVWANLNNLTDLYNVQQELKDAKEKAEESDRLKSAFLSNMSHEIRTPMNGILGFTELLKEPDLSGEEQEKYIEIIRKSGERMLDTVNDIIDISKIDAGQMEISTIDVNITEEMRSLYEFFKEEAFLKGLEMNLTDELSEGNPFVRTDRVKVNSIVSNLIKNAIKYTDEGTVNVLCDKQGSQLVIRVSDTGIGISKERIKSIFNRFEQADINDVHAREGSGLGLSISQAYADMLGGTIEVESEPGKGSTFVLTLPWVEKHETPKSVKEIGATGSYANTQSVKILVVEDDDTSFEHISILVGSISEHIDRVKNGRDAVDYVRNNNVDLILMDVKLPVMTGYEATKEIRKFNADVIIIAQTAYALSGEKDTAMAAGCNDYISKPINKNLLLKMMKKYLRRRSNT